ncbi:uncharacterized protein LOC128470510 [Spea bombifrons]|uniref:uncharacterized protein LOC128470510 n=1 Tax=Spea bombifrons TaxID=233779 RepID=UPI00234ADA81|nr:uncharacterized protein LOC128470510 [Spea bombifrons]
MNRGNDTTVKEFILLGLSEIPELQPFLFFLFLCIYIVTVAGNTSIILMYNISANLHTAMYFNLANFSFLEICYVSVFSPKLLADFLADQKTISFYGCALQMYCAFLLGTTECYLLAAMAYDRYNAICHPLLYRIIMNKRLCSQLISSSWLVGAANALVHTALTFSLPFCDDNKIDRFFCDVSPILKLACADTWINNLLIFIVSGAISVSSFVVTMISYIKIILAILSIHSSSGRKRAFSTCSSHITVVSIFYGSLFFVYLTPKSTDSVYQDRLVSVMYSIVAPLLNPFIYSLRNNEFKATVRKEIQHLRLPSLRAGPSLLNASVLLSLSVVVLSDPDEPPTNYGLKKEKEMQWRESSSKDVRSVYSTSYKNLPPSAFAVARYGVAPRALSSNMNQNNNVNKSLQLRNQRPLQVPDYPAGRTKRSTVTKLPPLHFNGEKMDRENYTRIKEFIFVGLSEVPEIQRLLFVVFLCIYMISVLGNTSLILAYRFSPDLNTPMYFYLANLSFLEICYISATVPKMLAGLSATRNAISFHGCAVQLYCFILLGGTECYMLAAMAYDRHNAICHPLLYSALMNRSVCIQLIAGSWLVGAANSLIHTVLTFSLSFCHSNEINHFFCDIPPLLELACTDTRANELVLLVTCGCVIVFSFLITMLSYIRIILAVLTIRSSSGRKKTFSTCTSHLIVVCLFYGSAIFMYFRPKSSYVMDQDRLISAMYAVIAPLINPFIYSLRNSKVKIAIKKMVCQIIIERTY